MPKQRKRVESVRKLAEKIAKVLFTDGCSGQVAQRLIQVDQTFDSFATGWSQKSVADQIEKYLKAARSKQR